MPKAVVLLSGGLDSAVSLAVAIREGFEAHALTIAYGQRHAVELDAAKRIAQTLGAASHKTVEVSLDKFGGSALTDDIPVPMGRFEDRGTRNEGSEERRTTNDEAADAPFAPSLRHVETPQSRTADSDQPSVVNCPSSIPSTYVPARNTVFLSLALAYAETLGAHDLFLGANVVDYSGYPDCRPECLEAFEMLANLATKAGVEGARFRIHAPLLKLAKTDIIRKGQELGLDLSLTHSCYAPDERGRACGRCDSCLIRKRAFEDLGLRDPALA
jgi:7-cyano-7-deazaguanine synthase